jgi:hypothetical protein
MVSETTNQEAGMIGGALYEQILRAEELTGVDWANGGPEVECPGLIMTKMARNFFDALKKIEMTDEGHAGAVAKRALRSKVSIGGCS